MTHRLTIVVPTLNEAQAIATTLERLQPLRGPGCEILVVDGGSDDDTVARAEPLADRVLAGPRGRARQMNFGAEHAQGHALLFLHADTLLEPKCIHAALEALDRGAGWGRFDVRLSGRHPLFPLIAWSMNLRSRLTGIATGDQALFMSRAAYDDVDGFPDIPLMEDIAISKRLKRLARPACIGHRIETSSRRWQSHGVVRTVLLMWRLRLGYFLGANPAALAERYRRT